MSQLQESLSPADAELPDRQIPKVFYGGVGYSALRNGVVLEEIQSMGHQTAGVLSDPAADSLDTNFTVVGRSGTHEVSQKEAKRLAYRPEVEVSTSNFQQHRADELLGKFEAEGTQRVDAIFQSADALNGLLAVSKQPGRFNNVVLAYPAGLVRMPEIRRAAPKVVPAEAAVRLKPRHLRAKRNNDFEGKRVKTKSVATSATVWSVGLSQHNKLLHEMRQKPDGPGIALVAGTDDIMLSPKKILESLESPDDLDLMLIADTPHGINGRRDVLEGVLDLFPQLEKIKQARQNGQPLAPLAERVIFMADVKPEKRREILGQAAAVDSRTAVAQAA